MKALQICSFRLFLSICSSTIVGADWALEVACNHKTSITELWQLGIVEANLVVADLSTTQLDQSIKEWKKDNPSYRSTRFVDCADKKKKLIAFAAPKEWNGLIEQCPEKSQWLWADSSFPYSIQDVVEIPHKDGVLAHYCNQELWYLIPTGRERGQHPFKYEDFLKTRSKLHVATEILNAPSWLAALLIEKPLLKHSKERLQKSAIALLARNLILRTEARAIAANKDQAFTLWWHSPTHRRGLIDPQNKKFMILQKDGIWVLLGLEPRASDRP